jgi:ABC-2 type transport system permease protein
VFVGVALNPPFGLRLSAQWWLAIPLPAVGTLAFLSIGLLVGTVARTEEAAAAVANFVVLPMAFLSGWLQTVSQALPLRRQTDGMLDVLVRGQGAAALLLPTAVLAGFALVLTAVATRVFSWDDV